MSFFCFLGCHKPSLSSMRRNGKDRYAALCEACALPLERGEGGRWKSAEPLAREPRTRTFAKTYPDGLAEQK